jgi:hypothetical protein
MGYATIGVCHEKVKAEAWAEGQVCCTEGTAEGFPYVPAYDDLREEMLI